MKYFTEDELRCTCCRNLKIDFDFLNKIEELREFLDFPFIVNSFYRCEKYNKSLPNSSPNSKHLTGNAIDIRATGVRALKLVQNATDYGITGIGVYSTFIHLDDGGKHGNRLRFWVGS